jgi:hypothetical protein
VRTIKTIISVLILSGSLIAQPARTYNSSGKNNIFISFGAPAMYSGLSYERLVFQKGSFQILPRAGLGINIFKPSLGKEFDMHTGITALYGKKLSKLELGLGLIHYFMQQYNMESEQNYHKYKPILYGVIGYRYDFKKNPVSFKFGISPVIFLNDDNNVLFPLIDLGIGLRIK